MGFPKIGGTILGVPVISIIVFLNILGSVLGSPDFGKLPKFVSLQGNSEALVMFRASLSLFSFSFFFSPLAART